MQRLILPAALAVLLSSVGCGGNPQAPAAPAASPIQHVVIIMQENRSFDNFFYQYPGADSATTGKYGSTTVTLKPTNLGYGPDLDHTHTAWWRDWNQGAMNGFASNGGLSPYTYIPESQVEPYWQLARQFTLGDRMFQSNTGPSFIAHQYMIAGQSGHADENPNATQWGCDAAPGGTVDLLGPNGTDLPGPFPCFDYQTLGDLLDAKNVSWRYYAPAATDSLHVLSAYDAVRHIRFGTDWQKNIINPETKVLTDIASGDLPQVTWVVPAANNSDHPSSPPFGPAWVSSIVNAIGASPLWSSTVVFIAWDDWGGWYDHVPPPQVDDMGLGFRVPLIVVSPYAKQGYISHVQHESGSMLRYIEENFGLGSLNTRDAISDDLSDCFDYTQHPLLAPHIQTDHSAAFFLAQKPSGPPDDD